MNQQDVVKSFMSSLSNHDFTSSDTVGKDMLDGAVRASSRYLSATDVIDAMKADQVAAEKVAVEEVLGEDFKGMTLAQAQAKGLPSLTWDNVKDKTNTSESFYLSASENSVSLADIIRENTAKIFLSEYCGIQLDTPYWVKNEGTTTHFTNEATAEVDTGAITGSDAGGSVDKTAESVVPETFANTYKATSNAAAQTIVTNERNWVIQATTNDDTITANGADSIDASDGSDTVTVNASGATIDSGAGNDTVTVSENVNDIILSDLTADDSLTIGGTFEFGSAQIVDGLLVVTDKTGTRKLRFGNYTDALDAKLNSTTVGQWLTNSGVDLYNLTSSNYSDGKVNGSSGNVAVDESGRIALDDYTPSTEQPAPKLMFRGLRSTGVDASLTVNGINVDASQAGDVTDDSENVIGAVSNEFPNAATFTRNGLTIHLLGESTDSSTNNITAKTLDQLSTDEQTVVAALFKWWAGEALKLNEDSYGIGFNSSTASVKDIGLYFYSNPNSSTLAAVSNVYRTDNGEVTTLYLNVNMAYYANIQADDVNGTSSVENQGYLDRTLAHEFTHAIMAANINFFSKLPQFVKEGTAELTHGIDDERGNVIFNLGYDANKLAAALNVDDTGTGDSDAYAGGYMFMRYLAKQAATQTETAPAFGEITATVDVSTDGIYYIDGTTTSETAQVASTLPEGAIKLGELANGVYTVNDTGVHQVISGVNKVSGLTVNDTFNGTDNADTVTTAQGSNIITGGGDDSIDVHGQFSTVNAGDGSDTVNVLDGSHHSIDAGDGDNLIVFETSSNYGNTVTSGDGNDTVKGGQHYDAIIGTGAGNDVVSLRSGSDNFVDLGAGNDSILFGGTGNTIVGGEGDDTVNQYSNTDGGNVFVYDAENFGNDDIWNFKATDKIILGAGFDYSISGNNITVTKGDATVGTIDVLTASGVTFDAATNIVTMEADSMVEPIDGLTYNAAGYYEISDAQDLVDLATYVNAGNTCANMTFKVTGNIDMSSVENFTQIVSDAWGEYYFAGTFDGQGYVISNLTITKGGTDDKAALFGLNRGTIKNVKLLNANISAYSAVAGIAVYNEGGTIENCFVDGTIHDTCGNNQFTAVVYDSYDMESDPTNPEVLPVEAKVENCYYHVDATDEYATKVYAVTAPEGFTISDINGGIKVGNKFFAASGEVTATVKATNNRLVIDGEPSFTATIDNADATLDVVGFYVQLADGETYANEYSNVSVLGSAGNDEISNTGDNVTIDGGAGNDEIFNGGASVLIDVSKGDDSISSFLVTEFDVRGFGVGDTINLLGTVNGLNVDGDKLIATVGTQSVTIGGISAVSTDGNNLWALDGTTAKYGDGKTAGAAVSDGKIIFTDAMVTDAKVQLGGISNLDGVSVFESTDFNIVNIDASVVGNNGASVVSNADNYAFYLFDDWDGKTFTGTDVADEIILDGTATKVSVNGGAGDDKIYNNASNVSVNGGAGNDNIINNGSNNTIDGGAGDDNITVYGVNNSIDGGADDDTIFLAAGKTGNTVNTAQGNDTIKINTENTVNDLTVEGFNVGDVIQFIDYVNNPDFDPSNFDPDNPDPDNPQQIEVAVAIDSLTEVDGKLVATAGGRTVTINGLDLSQGEGWSLDGNVAKYGDGKTAGAAVSDGKIIFTDAEVTDAKVELGGISKLDGLNVNTFNEVNIHASAVGDNGVSVVSNTDDEYSFELDGDWNGKTFTGTDGNDNISNTGTNVLINGGAGNDWIGNSDDSVTIDGGEGDDNITNNGDNVSINGGDGNDNITNNGDNVSINGGDGNDNITNTGSNVSINGGDGDDNITLLLCDNVTINAAEGNDTITVKQNVTDFTVENFTAGDVIQFIDGNASVEVTNLETVDGKLVATAGGKTVTINGLDLSQGEGWSLDGNTATYFTGSTSGAFIDGKQISFRESDTVEQFKLGGISKAPTVDGNKVQLTAYNFAGDTVSVTSNVGGYDFELSGELTGKTFTGSDGVDKISNAGTGVAINTGAGNDDITNSGNGVTVDAGAGNDTIENSSTVATIDGGAGSNTINLSGDNGTSNVIDDIVVKTDAGANTIKVGADMKKFSVNGFGRDDVIELNQLLNAASFSIVEGNLVAGNVTIGGLGTFDESGTFSEADDGKIVYAAEGKESIVIAQTTKNSAGEDVTTLVYRKDGSELSDTYKFTLTGLAQDTSGTYIFEYNSENAGSDTINHGFTITKSGDSETKHYAFATKTEKGAVELVEVTYDSETNSYKLSNGYTALKTYPLSCSAKGNGAIVVTLTEDVLDGEGHKSVSIAAADTSDTNSYFLDLDSSITQSTAEVTWEKVSDTEMKGTANNVTAGWVANGSNTITYQNAPTLSSPAQKKITLTGDVTGLFDINENVGTLKSNVAEFRGTTLYIKSATGVAANSSLTASGLFGLTFGVAPEAQSLTKPEALGTVTPESETTPASVDYMSEYMTAGLSGSGKKTLTSITADSDATKAKTVFTLNGVESTEGFTVSKSGTTYTVNVGADALPTFKTTDSQTGDETVTKDVVQTISLTNGDGYTAKFSDLPTKFPDGTDVSTTQKETEPASLVVASGETTADVKYTYTTAVYDAWYNRTGTTEIVCHSPTSATEYTIEGLASGLEDTTADDGQGGTTTTQGTWKTLVTVTSGEADATSGKPTLNFALGLGAITDKDNNFVGKNIKISTTSEKYNTPTVTLAAGYPDAKTEIKASTTVGVDKDNKDALNYSAAGYKAGYLTQAEVTEGASTYAAGLSDQSGAQVIYTEKRGGESFSLTGLSNYALDEIGADNETDGSHGVTIAKESDKIKVTVAKAALQDAEGNFEKENLVFNAGEDLTKFDFALSTETESKVPTLATVSDVTVEGEQTDASAYATAYKTAYETKMKEAVTNDSGLVVAASLDEVKAEAATGTETATTASYNYASKHNSAYFTKLQAYNENFGIENAEQADDDAKTAAKAKADALVTEGCMAADGTIQYAFYGEGSVIDKTTFTIEGLKKNLGTDAIGEKYKGDTQDPTGKSVVVDYSNQAPTVTVSKEALALPEDGANPLKAESFAIKLSDVKVNGAEVTDTAKTPKLALADGVPKVEDIAFTWEENKDTKGTYTFTIKGTTAGLVEVTEQNKAQFGDGYNVGDFVYQAQTGGQQFTISGLQSGLQATESEGIITALPIKYSVDDKGVFTFYLTDDVVIDAGTQATDEEKAEFDALTNESKITITANGYVTKKDSQTLYTNETPSATLSIDGGKITVDGKEETVAKLTQGEIVAAKWASTTFDKDGDKETTNDTIEGFTYTSEKSAFKWTAVTPEDTAEGDLVTEVKFEAAKGGTSQIFISGLKEDTKVTEGGINGITFSDETGDGDSKYKLVSIADNLLNQEAGKAVTVVQYTKNVTEEGLEPYQFKFDDLPTAATDAGTVPAELSAPVDGVRTFTAGHTPAQYVSTANDEVKVTDVGATDYTYHAVSGKYQFNVSGMPASFAVTDPQSDTGTTATSLKGDAIKDYFTFNIAEEGETTKVSVGTVTLTEAGLAALDEQGKKLTITATAVQLDGDGDGDTETTKDDQIALKVTVDGNLKTSKETATLKAAELKAGTEPGTDETGFNYDYTSAEYGKWYEVPAEAGEVGKATTLEVGYNAPIAAAKQFELTGMKTGLTADAISFTGEKDDHVLLTAESLGAYDATITDTNSDKATDGGDYKFTLFTTDSAAYTELKTAYINDDTEVAAKKAALAEADDSGKAEAQKALTDAETKAGEAFDTAEAGKVVQTDKKFHKATFAGEADAGAKKATYTFTSGSVKENWQLETGDTLVTHDAGTGADVYNFTISDLATLGKISVTDSNTVDSADKTKNTHTAVTVQAEVGNETKDIAKIEITPAEGANTPNDETDDKNAKYTITLYGDALPDIKEAGTIEAGALTYGGKAATNVDVVFDLSEAGDKAAKYTDASIKAGTTAGDYTYTNANNTAGFGFEKDNEGGFVTSKVVAVGEVGKEEFGITGLREGLIYDSAKSGLYYETEEDDGEGGKVKKYVVNINDDDKKVTVHADAFDASKLTSASKFTFNGDVDGENGKYTLEFAPDDAKFFVKKGDATPTAGAATLTKLDADSMKYVTGSTSAYFKEDETGTQAGVSSFTFVPQTKYLSVTFAGLASSLTDAGFSTTDSTTAVYIAENTETTDNPNDYIITLSKDALPTGEALTKEGEIKVNEFWTYTDGKQSTSQAEYGFALAEGIKQTQTLTDGTPTMKNNSGTYTYSGPAYDEYYQIDKSGKSPIIKTFPAQAASDKTFSISGLGTANFTYSAVDKDGVVSFGANKDNLNLKVDETNKTVTVLNSAILPTTADAELTFTSLVDDKAGEFYTLNLGEGVLTEEKKTEVGTLSKDDEHTLTYTAPMTYAWYEQDKTVTEGVTKYKYHAESDVGYIYVSNLNLANVSDDTVQVQNLLKSDFVVTASEAGDAGAYTPGNVKIGSNLLYDAKTFQETFASDLDGVDRLELMTGTEGNDENKQPFANYTVSLADDTATKALMVDEIEAALKPTNGVTNGYTYNASGSSAGYANKESKIFFNKQKGGEPFKITGVNLDGVTMSEENGVTTFKNGEKTYLTVNKTGTVTLYKDALLEEPGKITFQDADATDKVEYKLTFAEDIATVAAVDPESGKITKLEAGTATYTTKYTPLYYTEGATADDGTITYDYHPKTGGYTFTITGLNSDITKIQDLTGISFTEGTASEGKLPITVTITSKDILSRSNNIKIVDTNNTNATFELTSAVTAEDGKADANLSAPVDGVRTYTAAITGGNYYAIKAESNNKELTYKEMGGGETFTITGIKATARLGTDIEVGEATEEGNKKIANVTVEATALDKSNIVFTDAKGDAVNDALEYKLVLGEGINTTGEQKAATVEAGTAENTLKYTAAEVPEYYKLLTATEDGYKEGSTTYKYNAKTGGDTFIITNVNNTKDVTVSDLNVTLPVKDKNGNVTTKGIVELTAKVLKPSFTEDTVLAITGEALTDYQLKLGSDTTALQAKAIEEGFVDGSGETANKLVYNASGSTAGYSDGTDKEVGKIFYKLQTGGAQFAVSGLEKSNIEIGHSASEEGKNVIVDNNEHKVTVKSGALPTEWTTITFTDLETGTFNQDKYTLTLDEELKKTTKEGATITSATEIPEGGTTDSLKYTAALVPKHFENGVTDAGTTTFAYVQQKGGESFTVTGTKAMTEDEVKALQATAITVTAPVADDLETEANEAKAGVITLGDNLLTAEPEAGKTKVILNGGNDYKDYELAVSEGKQSKAIEVGFENDTFTAAGKTAGYEAKSAQELDYVDKTGGKQFTLTGVNLEGATVSTSGDTVTYTSEDGTTKLLEVNTKSGDVTLYKGALTEKSNIVFTDLNEAGTYDDVEYKLTLASTGESSIATAASAVTTVGTYTVEAGTATYTTKATGAWYEKTEDGVKDENTGSTKTTFTYQAPKGGGKVTVSGLNDEAGKSDIKFVETTGEGDAGVTVTAEVLEKTALDKKAVEIGDVTDAEGGVKYTTALAASTGITQAAGTPIEQSFVDKSGTYTYTAEGRAAFYSQTASDTNKITYTAQDGGQQFTISGLKSGLTTSNIGAEAGDDVSIVIKDTAVTVYKDALPAEAQRKDIVFTDLKEEDETNKKTFTLALASTGEGSIAQEEGEANGKVSIKSGTVYYTTRALEDYYKPGQAVPDTDAGTTTTTYTYMHATANETVTVSGFNSTTGLENTTAEITVNAETGAIEGYEGLKIVEGTQADGKTPITITVSEEGYLKTGNVTAKVGSKSKYTAAIEVGGNIATKATDKEDAWTQSGTTATYKTEVKKAYYEVGTGAEASVLTYHKETDGVDALVLGGINSSAWKENNAAPTLSDGVFTFSTNIGVANGVSVTSNKGYKANKTDTVNTPYSFVIGAEDMKFLGTDAADTITVSGAKASVNAGKGDDILTVSGEGATVNASVGNDEINVTGAASVDAGAGNDKLTVSGANASVNAGAGNDEIEVSAAAYVNGGAGADTITIKGAATVDGGAGNDTFNYESGAGAATVLFGSGSGKDTINYSDKYKVSVVGSTTPKAVLIETGEKYDVQLIYDNSNTLLLTDVNTQEGALGGAIAKVTVDVGGKEVELEAGTKMEDMLTYNNKDIAKATAVSLNTAALADKGKADGKIPFAGTQIIPKDYEADPANPKIVNISAAGIDIQDLYIEGNSLSNVIVGGTAGNSIDGGEGNDKLTGGAGADTLIGGKGNDTLTGGSSLTSDAHDVFVYEEGNDVITDFQSGETIKVVGGEVTGTSISSNNIIFDVEHKGEGEETVTGKISLKGAFSSKVTATTINITDESGKAVSSYVYHKDGSIVDEENGSITLTSGFTPSSIKTDEKITKVQDDANKAVKIDVSKANGATVIGSSNGGTIITGAGNDSFEGNTTKATDLYVYQGGNDTFNNFDANDAVSLVGSGHASIGDIAGITLTAATPKAADAEADAQDTPGAATISFGDEKDGLTLKGMGIDNRLKINGTTYYVGTNAFMDKATDPTKVTLTSGATGEYTLESTATSSTIDAANVTGALKITGTDKNNSIAAAQGGGTISVGGGKDTVKLSDKETVDTIIYTAGTSNKLTVKQFGAKDSIQLISATEEQNLEAGNVQASVKGDDVIFTITDKKANGTVKGGTITVEGAAKGNGMAIALTDGAGKAISNYIYTKDGIKSSNGTEVTLGSSFNLKSLTLGTTKGYEEVTKLDASATSKLVTISTASDEAVTIIGNAKNNVITGGEGEEGDSLNGGKGKDTIHGGTGKNTLTGGEGDDLFVIEGTDFITDYGVGSDKISLKAFTMANIDSVKVKADDEDAKSGTIEIGFKPASEGEETTLSVHVTNTSSAVTFMDADNKSGKAYKFVDGGYAIGSSVTLLGGGEVDMAEGGYQNYSTLTANDAATVTGRGSATKIVLNKGGKATGGKGKDTLVAADDATLKGGEGADTFVYNGGKVEITDYDKADKVSLGAGWIITEIGEGMTLSLKNGDETGTLTLTNVGSDTPVALTTTSTKGKATSSSVYFNTGIITNKSDRATSTAVTVLAGAKDDSIDFSEGATKLSSITAVSVTDGTLKANKNANTIVVEGDVAAARGGIGADTYIIKGGKNVKIEDFGIGTTQTLIKEDGKDKFVKLPVSTTTANGSKASIVAYNEENLIYAPGTDIIKVNGSITSAVYDLSDDKSTFSVGLSVDYDIDGKADGVIVLNDIKRNYKNPNTLTNSDITKDLAKVKIYQSTKATESYTSTTLAKLKATSGSISAMEALLNDGNVANDDLGDLSNPSEGADLGNGTFGNGTFGNNTPGDAAFTGNGGNSNGISKQH